MRCDSLVIHEDDIGAIVGEFYGTPIHEVDTFAVSLREIRDAQNRVLKSLGTEYPPVELLPNEVIKDGIIRHYTAAEVIGEAFYELPV